MKIHDISIPISNTLATYKGDAGFKIDRTSDFGRGDVMVLSHIDMGVHTGTHVDAPLHFVPGGGTIDQLDLNVLMGPAQVVDLPHTARAISALDLQATHIPDGTQRLLIRTSNCARWDKPEFQEDFVALGVDAAQWLLDHNIKLVGIDYLSIEPFGSTDHPVHHLLLNAHIVVVEGLDLRAIQPGTYDLVCLPIKLAGAEGAPARAVLIER
ncbi:MAG: cyclase family protein [Anaerolineae bacterium]